MSDEPAKHRSFFERMASTATNATGSPVAFVVAVIVIIGWAASGPIFKFSDTWQLVINTSTTIITFLMVFVIQHSQNKETAAMQLKLNELIASNANASNRLIDIEDLSDAEIQTIKRFYVELSRLAEDESDIHCSHSIDEAKGIHEEKLEKAGTLGKKKAGVRRKHKGGKPGHTPAQSR